jgi:hypothetical protein
MCYFNIIVMFLVLSSKYWIYIFGHFVKKISAQRHGPKDFWKKIHKICHISSYKPMNLSFEKKDLDIFLAFFFKKSPHLDSKF